MMANENENLNNEEFEGEEMEDIIEFEDEDGNTIALTPVDYFFYNGDEYAVLVNADAHECGCCCEECEHAGEEEECGPEGVDAYIMQVVEKTVDGEEVEEYVPVEDDELYQKLVEIATTNFNEDEALDEE